MTISAFGVDHGEISKGLPSALRSKSPQLWDRKGYVNSKLKAHKFGQHAGKRFAEGKKNPFVEPLGHNAADMGRFYAYDAKIRLNSKGSKRLSKSFVGGKIGYKPITDLTRGELGNMKYHRDLKATDPGQFSHIRIAGPTDPSNARSAALKNAHNRRIRNKEWTKSQRAERGEKTSPVKLKRINPKENNTGPDARVRGKHKNYLSRQIP